MKTLPALIISLWVVDAQAGAWTQPAGGGQVITSVSDYATDSFFNKDGGRGPQSGSYHKVDVNAYAEYGLTDAYTIGFQPDYQWLHSGPSAKTNGFSDTPLFARERLWHNDYNVFSVQELLTIPGAYNRNAQPALGYGQSDAELRGLYGYSGKVSNLPYFIDLEGAYRERFDGPADEIRADATLGVTPFAGFTVLGQSFNTIGLRDPSTPAIATINGPDYDLATLQLSGVIDVPHGVSFQVGGAADVDGRNTGGGRSLFVAVWKRF